MDFGRLITAMVTPFDQDLKIDFEATKKLVNHLIATGTDTIVVSGTTGESPTLDRTEKIQLFEKVLEFTDGRAKVIAGTGSNSTAASIELTKKAEEIGVDGIMIVAPYYNKPTQEGLYQHFSTIAATTMLPIMIYNVPGRTSINIQAKTTVALSKVKNIVAVKEASGDLTQMAEIIRDTAEDFILYSGDDKLTIPVMAIGGYGIVSVASHVVGKQMKEMLDLFVSGNVIQAAHSHQTLLELFEGIFITSNPSPIKDILNQLGVNVGGVRLPLIPLTEQQSKNLFAIYNKAI